MPLRLCGVLALAFNNTNQIEVTEQHPGCNTDCCTRYFDHRFTALHDTKLLGAKVAYSTLLVNAASKIKIKIITSLPPPPLYFILFLFL